MHAARSKPATWLATATLLSTFAGAHAQPTAQRPAIAAAHELAPETSTEPSTREAHGASAGERPRAGAAAEGRAAAAAEGRAVAAAEERAVAAAEVRARALRVPELAPSTRAERVVAPAASDDPCAGKRTSGEVAGTTDLNTASAEELERLPGIGPSRALAILELRARLRRFTRVEDLMRVKGIGRATFRKLRPSIRLGPMPSAPPSAAPSALSPSTLSPRAAPPSAPPSAPTTAAPPSAARSALPPSTLSPSAPPSALSSSAPPSGSPPTSPPPSARSSAARVASPSGSARVAAEGLE